MGGGREICEIKNCLNCENKLIIWKNPMGEKEKIVK